MRARVYPHEETMMTWKEFKAAVEEFGVTDETEITYIDWGMAYVTVFDEGDGSIHIGESFVKPTERMEP